MEGTESLEDGPSRVQSQVAADDSNDVAGLFNLTSQGFPVHRQSTPAMNAETSKCRQISQQKKGSGTASEQLEWSALGRKSEHRPGQASDSDPPKVGRNWHSEGPLRWIMVGEQPLHESVRTIGIIAVLAKPSSWVDSEKHNGQHRLSRPGDHGKPGKAQSDRSAILLALGKKKSRWT